MGPRAGRHPSLPPLGSGIGGARLRDHTASEPGSWHSADGGCRTAVSGAAAGGVVAPLLARSRC